MKRIFGVAVSLLLLLSFMTTGAIAAQSTYNQTNGINGEDRDDGFLPKQDELRFAEDRVIVKLASISRSRSMKPFSLQSLGIGFSKMRLLNPTKETTPAEGSGIQTFSATGMTETQNNVYVLTLEETGKDAVKRALELLNDNPMVEVAEPDYLYKLSITPNDPQYNAQYALEKIGAPQAWDITTGSKSVVVGVIDTGIEGTHPDLKDNLWVNPNPNQNGYTDDTHGYNFTGKNGGIPTDIDGHGTHVAGIIGAKGNNGLGISGGNWDVSLAWLGIDEGDGYVSASAAIEALNYANNHDIFITNNSYGGGEYSKIFEEAILDYNGLFVASAGNYSSNNDKTPYYPASYDCPNIISVASTDRSDKLSSFSNYGASSVDIAAPGSDILSTYLDGTYRELSGTSMASPYVAGVAALIKAEHPDYTTEELKSVLLDGADILPGLADKAVSGRRLDTYHALTPRLTVDSVDITPGSLTLDINQAGKLLAEVSPSGAIQAVRWESSDVDTVMVAQNGGVIALKSGSAIITARSFIDPSKSASVTVTVTDDVSDGIRFLDPTFKQAVIDELVSIDASMYENYSIANNLYPTDAQKIIRLAINDLGITDMEGLQYFTNLEVLDCGSNEITSLDVSNNPNLWLLACYANQLTSLDVSNNPNLEYLSCPFNQLTGLDVSNNPKLFNLDCAYNRLTGLDVSNNSELYILHCEDNQLGSLDVSNNLNLAALVCMNNQLTNLDVNSAIYEIYCMNNQLTSLDVSSCTALHQLSCASNQLTSLDVSSCTELMYLYCRSNQLTSLDVSDCTMLTELSCYANQLVGLDVSNSSNLDTLYCFDNPLALIRANIRGRDIRLTANGQGIVELYYSPSDYYAQAIPISDLVCWTQSGNRIGTQARFDLEEGQDYDLTAHFTDFFAVKFDSQGGSAVYPIFTAPEPMLIQPPILPIRMGYEFNEWYKEPTCQNKWDFETDMVGSDMTLYAKWTAISATGIELNKDKLMLPKGSNETLIATIKPWNANQNVTWCSDDETVAAVDNNGKVTALNEGTAVITVTAEDGGFTTDCTVTVFYIPVTGVELNKDKLTLAPDGNETLIAMINPWNATNQAVEWDSSDKTVASVDGTGRVTAHKGGTAVITVATMDGGFTADCTVTVNVPVTGIVLNDELTLTVGSGGMLTATVMPWDATNRLVTWNSSDTTIAIVDENGIVTALKAGTANITVTTAEGGFMANCTVTVVDVPVTGVVLNIDKLKLTVGDSEILTATVKPWNAKNQAITWRSDDETVATVDNTGKITAYKAGLAVITVATMDGGFTADCTVTVNEQINAKLPTITGQPKDITVDVGGKAALSIIASVDQGTLSYQWYENATQTNIGGVLIAGAISSDYNAPTKTIGIRYYYCVVTNTDNTATGNRTASVVSNVVSVMVNPSTYVITIVSNNKAFGTVKGGGSCALGTNITLTAIPKQGYCFVRWMEGSEQVSTSYQYKFTTTKARTLKAEFAIIGIPGAVKAVSASYNSVKLNWAIVPGAVSYEISRTDSKSGKYIVINKVTKTNYIDTKRVTGKRYYYKVRAVCQAGNITTTGDASAAKSAQPILAKTASLTAKKGKLGVTLNWKKVTGATSYVIYRSTKQKSGFRPIMDINKTTFTDKDKKLRKGKLYYYKVCPCRMVNGKKVYGSFSDVKNAKK